MQSIFGALLTAGYAAAAGTLISQSGAHINTSVENQLTKSFDGAASIADRYPRHASQIIAGAKTAFLDGDRWAYLAGIIAVLAGAALVAVFFPKKKREEQLLASYHATDVGDSADEPPPHPSAPVPA